MDAITNNGRYKVREVVGTYNDKFGEKQIIHRPKGRALRVLKEMNTPALRMNRVASTLIGQLIKKRRVELGISLEECATRAGLRSQSPKQYMWEIENDVRQSGVRMGTLYAIARALDCEVGSFLPEVSVVEDAAMVFDKTIVRAE